MDLDKRRVVTRRNGSVVAGSVWESRMKSDEIKGGIKVFDGEENSPENGTDNSTNNSEIQAYQRMRAKQSVVGVGVGKRKTWKSENSEGFERNPIQIAKQRSENKKNLGEQCKELSVSVDGIKKSPIQLKKTRSEGAKDLSLSVDGIERSPIQKMKTRSVSMKESSESSDGIERNSISIPLRKVKSESSKAVDESNDGIERNAELGKMKSKGSMTLDGSVDGDERNSIPSVKGKLVTNKVMNETVCGNGIEKDSIELRKEIVDEGVEKISVKTNTTRSDENLEEFDVCEEKVITSNLDNVGRVKSSPKLEVAVDDSEEDWDEVMAEEIDEEIEKKSIDLKEMNKSEQKPISPKLRKQIPHVVIEEKKIHQRNEKPVPISAIVRKQPPPPPRVVSNSRIISKPTITKPTPVAHESPRVHSKLQSFVDLIMWRDASKSAFIFGMGTFAILSSSYTRDLNISFISVVSYMGLVYLAAIFLFRSIICRAANAMDIDDTNQDHVVGEEEAVWLLKLILPCINEFLLNVRALFSGDPATTMKLAVLLFVLARCGSYITIWKMVKLGFFGVFTVPKICCSYSPQLTAYGTFWVRRFRDAWETCSHKKAVAFAIFTLVWNLSSIVARIWAVFMVVVAFRYYQQSMMREGWAEQEEEPQIIKQKKR